MFAFGEPRMTRTFPPVRLAMLVVITLLAAAPGWAAQSVVTSARAAEPQGTIIAQLPFNPRVNGFKFENYGNDHVYRDDLLPADMIRIFGASKVCSGPVSGGTCTLKAAARNWMNQQIAVMDGGHCEGMAVTSLRFLKQQPFKNKRLPRDFQAGATSVFTLNKAQPIENYIASYFALQGLDEVYEPTAAIRDKPPSEILQLLYDSLDAGTDPMTMGIYKYVDGELTEGHAITPFAIEEMDNGTYRVHVYDNNYPGETRYVTFNLDNETWRYVTTTKPGEPVDVYSGNANTKSLELTPLSVRNRSVYTCPFCPPPPGLAAATQAEPEQVEFSLNGEGDILIENAQGQQVGFDVETGTFVNEIAGTDVIPFKGGLGKDIPPDYQIPVDGSDAPLEILVSGKTLTSETDVDLTMVGPGLAVGFDYIQLDPGELLYMRARPDGQQLSFTASSDTLMPLLSFGLDADETGASYIVEIDGAELLAGRTVTATLDLDAGRFYFEDDDGGSDDYDIALIRINPDGTEEAFAQDNVALGDTGEAYLDFGNWNEGEEMCYITDEDGDGYADEVCEQLVDEEHQIFVPLVVR
jgi:hypothetical protein